jgi:hypothetical protein
MFKEMNKPNFSFQGTITVSIPARENILGGGHVSKKYQGQFLYTE